MVFDKDWFKQHQSKLLWLLNTPLVKRWFRWVLRIRKEDLNISKPIYEIGPNYFIYHVKKLSEDNYELKTSFRSNEKYARRLWFAFEPLWWVLHAWDMVTKPIPALNLGFDTLPTKYSTPGATVSGTAYWTGAETIFGTARTNAGTNGSYDTGTNGMNVKLVAGTTSAKYTYLFRSIFLFDCSALSDTATITDATINLYSDLLTTGLGDFECDIVASAPASNTILAYGDYNTLSTTPFSSVASASLAANAYRAFTLNASGLANISKTAISKFGATLNWDTDNSFGGTWASEAISRVQFSDGGYTGTTRDPKIDITYTLSASGGINLTLLGVG